MLSALCPQMLAEAGYGSGQRAARAAPTSFPAEADVGLLFWRFSGDGGFSYDQLQAGRLELLPVCAAAGVFASRPSCVQSSQLQLSISCCAACRWRTQMSAEKHKAAPPSHRTEALIRQAASFEAHFHRKESMEQVSCPCLPSTRVTSSEAVGRSLNMCEKYVYVYMMVYVYVYVYRYR